MPWSLPGSDAHKGANRCNGPRGAIAGPRCEPIGRDSSAADAAAISTWRLGPDGWKLIAHNVHASLLDPPAITLPATQLDDYIGTYRLNDAITYTIRRDGDHLIGQRTDRPAQPLRVEARDVLFVPGQPRSRKIFLRDPSGQITRFADSREARDILWTRVRM